LTSRISKAQAHDATVQLNAGVRYFDARITLVNGEYYTSHGFLSVHLSSVLTEIITFLNSHPGEFILFHIAQNYPLNQSFEPLAEYIASVTVDGKSLFDFVNYDTTETNPSLITYNDVTANHTKGGVVILSNATGLEAQYTDYFKINAFSVWHDAMDHTLLLEKADSYYQTMIGNSTFDNKFCINQLQCTPSYSDIWSALASWSLLNKAQTDNVESIDYPNFATWLQEMPIVIFDYTTSTYGNFNMRVISILTEYNLSLT